MPKGSLKCPHCKTFFRPRPSTRHHQRYCSVPACQKARKAKNNQQFRKANPDYFKGPFYVKKVQDWRHEKPGYWRRQSPPRPRTPKDDDALQAVLIPQLIDNKLLTIDKDITTLQAVSNGQLLIIKGLAHLLSGHALQAELDQLLASLYDKGSQIGGTTLPWENTQTQQKEVANGRHSTASAGTPATDTTDFQLGRSPSHP